MASTGKFLYFGFGSNLLTKRIHINNPSAVKKAVAKLENYQLTFGNFSKNWGGASATIKPCPGSHVWGILWVLDDSNLPSLDRQEGVPFIYQPFTVTVTTASGEKYEARTYHLVTGLDKEPIPSALYLGVIKAGAKEHGLPESYQEFLAGIKDNGFMGYENSPCQFPKDPFEENF